MGGRGLGVLLVVSVLSARALAQDVEPAPRVELALEGAWPDALRGAVRADLEASLRAQGLELVHAADGAERVVATVRVTAPRDEARSALIAIDDVVTGKHVERAVDLTRVPEDGWSVAIAAGADELLRASWAELAILGAPPPAIEPPAAVETLVEDRVVRPLVEQRVARALDPELPRPSLALGARGALESYVGGQTLLGGDLMLRLWLASRVGLELAAGARAGLDVDTARGRVRSWSLGGELGPTFLLVPPPSPVRLEAFVVARVAYVAYDPDANEGSLAQRADGVAVIGRVGLRAAVGIDRSELGVQLGVGVPFLGFDASDESGAITGVSGVEVHAAITFLAEVMP